MNIKLHHINVQPPVVNNQLPMHQEKSTVRNQSGFSLIEIMVAAVILSIGILGVASLQIISMKGTHQSYMKHQAMSIVQNLTERMRSNTAGLVAGNYQASSKGFDCSVLPVCNVATSNCSASDIAKVDLNNIFCGYGSGARTGGVKKRSATATDDKVILSNGSVVIRCTGATCATGDVSIDVGWTERELGKETATVINGATDHLIVNTRILP